MNADGSVTTYTIDASDQVTTQVDSDGVTTYTYNAAGNMTEKDAPDGTTFYTHDAANQLVEAEPHHPRPQLLPTELWSHFLPN